VKEHRDNREILITAGFYEPFRAMDAIQALNRVGFEDGDIGVVGVLEGLAQELAGFCQSLGMPPEHAFYYQTSFEDGGVLLIVRAREFVMKKVALAVLNEQGGLLPPTIQ
jgi:hypothetical protein